MGADIQLSTSGAEASLGPSIQYQYRSTNTSLESQTKVQRWLWCSFLISLMGLTISSLSTGEAQLRFSIFERSSIAECHS